MYVVCVIWLECKYGLHVLHVSYLLVIKLLQVVSMCYHIIVVTPVILCLTAQFQYSKNLAQLVFGCDIIFSLEYISCWELIRQRNMIQIDYEINTYIYIYAGIMNIRVNIR